ncbi:mismatch-specific thymine-dna glycosylate [Trichoderma arundinaceum]|uniref:Mismatch-specific thymine-dna glycosylate n=1 Tax=Trichoderma arundinaceum TaxID=490622 RepID=A0A395NH33_TRIAR|nr:mismatch-specific thymine-dna glycosylate [Trichoderma arundinaceum]
MEPGEEIPNTGENADSRKPATFQGRLQLKDFVYSVQQPLRRSPRFPGGSESPSSSSAVSVTARSPSSSSSASKKRRQPTESGSSPWSPQKKKRSSGYAPPSTYAHLPLLPDAVGPNLLVFFIGLNPGIETARKGHAYAHPSNLFWKLLYSSGVTPRPCRADEDRQMPELYSLGLTNIVARPSRNGAELSKQEMDDGVALLEEKARQWRPESMCVVGKSIWESIWRVRHGSPVGKAFKYGWQDKSENMGVIKGEWAGAKVFVATSTSGLAASMSLAEKQAVWDQLGSWVKARRAEREAEKEGEAQKEEEAENVKAVDDTDP